MLLGDTSLSDEVSPVGIGHLRTVPATAAPTLHHISQSCLIAIEEIQILLLCGLVARSVHIRTLVVLGPTAPCDIVAGTHGRALIDNLLEGKRSVVTYLHLTLLTALGCHKNNTVSTTATIDSGRRGILQNVDALDIAGVQRLNATGLKRHTVNNVERAPASRDRTLATDSDATQSTRTLAGGDVHTGCLTLQCFESIVHGLGVQFLLTHTSKGTGHVALTLYAITYYHNLVEHLLVLFESDID